MIFDAGQLNKRVDIYKPATTTKDSWDTQKDTALYKRIAAAIYPARGREYYEAKEIANEESVKIVIRYRKHITDGCKVRYREHTYLIQSVVDPDMAHESLELYCIEKLRGNMDTTSKGWEP